MKKRLLTKFCLLRIYPTWLPPVNEVVSNGAQALSKRGMTSFIEQYRKELIERIERFRSVIGYPEWARERG